MEELPTRDAIDPQYKWDLTSIYESDDAWERQRLATIERINGFSRYEGQLEQGPQRVAECLGELQDLQETVGKIYVYAHSKYAVNTRDQQAGAQKGQAVSLRAKLLAASAYVEPELLEIGPITLQRWAAENDALSIYMHYFHTLQRRAPHVRSGEIEELLGQLEDPFESSAATHSILANADLRFEPAHTSDGQPREVAQGSIDTLVTSPDRELRRSAWESYADAHLIMKNTMANCLLTQVKQSVFLASTRRYGSALEAALSANYIPTDVYHNVIDTFQAYLPVWHRYWAFRRRALGYDALHPYDLKSPLRNDQFEIPFERALDWVCEGLAPLGSEYVQVMREGVRNENWVDVYPNRGKTAGAFSSGSPGTSPLILMSCSDDVYSLSTLAHELGHSMHSLYTWRRQPMIYSDYSIFVAEVASNVHQALVRHHLLETADDPRFRFAVIEEAMSNFYRYFFLMPTLARFELATHEGIEAGKALTADSLIENTASLFDQGYGGEVVYDEKRVGITWAEFHTHLYANFYVYQYTTGISAAHVLSQRLLAREPGAREAYLAFLEAGASRYPLALLKETGVDLTSPEPIRETFEYLGELVNELEVLWKEL